MDNFITALSIAVTQAQSFMDWGNLNGCFVPDEKVRFVTFVRPSGVVDLFVVADGGGYVSDDFNHIGFINLQNQWVETYGSDPTLGYCYYNVAQLFGCDFTIVAAGA